MTDAEERADLVASLQRSRFFLKHTLRDLDDEQVTRRTTVSELTLGGLVRHVGRAEQQWSNFIVEGPSAMAAFGDPAVVADWLAAFEMAAGETVRDVLSDYAAVASRTDELVMRLPDLDASQPLPSAPWFEPGATWNARRVVLHIIAEIAQHAGHADIIREAFDGAKSMG